MHIDIEEVQEKWLGQAIANEALQFQLRKLKEQFEGEKDEDELELEETKEIFNSAKKAYSRKYYTPKQAISLGLMTKQEVSNYLMPIRYIRTLSLLKFGE